MTATNIATKKRPTLHLFRPTSVAETKPAPVNDTEVAPSVPKTHPNRNQKDAAQASTSTSAEATGTGPYLDGLIAKVKAELEAKLSAKEKAAEPPQVDIKKRKTIIHPYFRDGLKDDVRPCKGAPLEKPAPAAIAPASNKPSRGTNR